MEEEERQLQREDDAVCAGNSQRSWVREAAFVLLAIVPHSPSFLSFDLLMSHSVYQRNNGNGFRPLLASPKARLTHQSSHKRSQIGPRIATRARNWTMTLIFPVPNIAACQNEKKMHKQMHKRDLVSIQSFYCGLLPAACEARTHTHTHTHRFVGGAVMAWKQFVYTSYTVVEWRTRDLRH